MRGRTVSHYEVAEKLGEGGMGVVYLARDRKLQRLVVLKFIAPRLSAEPDRIARFKEEGKALSALNHPNIETIYDIEESDGEAFLVLEYLPGGTLSSVLAEQKRDQRQLPFDRVVQYGIDIAEGLDYAHRHAVIHRDIKTSNLMLTEAGAIKITDFGLAKLADGIQVTATGTTIGTPSYMSPEQAEGRAVDNRSDIFALGVVLFELVAGRVPFQASTPAGVLYEIVHKPIPALREFRSGVPAGLEAVVRRALEKNPDDRYQSLAPLVSDLRKLQRNSVQDTVAAELPPVRHRRRWPILAGAVAAVIALGIVWYGLSHRKITLPAEKSLAILPFTCMPKSPANEAFCDGLIDNLTARAARLDQFQRSLFVVPAGDVRRGGVKSTEDVSRRLGATLALTGSIDRAGNQVTLSAKLVDASDSRVLGSFNKTYQIGDLASSIQSGLVDDVAQLLEIELTPQSRKAIAADATSNASAYELYLTGRGYLQASHGSSSVDNAIEVFQQARERDSTYALAYAGIAEAFMLKYKATEDAQFLEMAEPVARRALELNGNVAEIHITMGLIDSARTQYPQAVAEFERALQVDPANPDATVGLAAAYEDENDLAAAESTYERAVKLRPTYFRAYDRLGTFLLQHGRSDAAESVLKRALDLNPRYSRGWNTLGVLYLMAARYSEARSCFERSLAIEPTLEANTNLAVLFQYQGRNDSAVPYFEKALQLTPNSSTAWGNAAQAYRLTGQTAKSVEAYRRAIELGENDLRLKPNDMALKSKLAVFEAGAGHAERAMLEIAQAFKKSSRDRDVLYNAALVYELTDRRDEALKMLESANKAGYPAEEIRKEPELARLRADPRFARLSLQ